MAISELIEGFALFELLILLGGVTLGLMRWNDLAREFQVLTVYLLGVLLIEVLAKLYIYVWTDLNNIYLLHIYAPFEFLLISRFYELILPLTHVRKKQFRLLYFTVAGVLVLYSAYHLFSGDANAPLQFQLYSKALVNGCIMVYSAFFVILGLMSPGRFLDHDKLLFAVNASMMLYFSGTFVIFLTLNYLLNNNLSKTIYFWLINVALTFILHFVMLVALWKKPVHK